MPVLCEARLRMGAHLLTESPALWEAVTSRAASFVLMKHSWTIQGQSRRPRRKLGAFRKA